jgi:hypothetical protein
VRLLFLCVLCVWSGSSKKDVGELKGAIAVWELRGCDRCLGS